MNIGSRITKEKDSDKQCIREAAKKSYILILLFLSLNSREMDLTTFFLPTIFGLKEPYFLPNIATNLLKAQDFANIVSIDILICRLK